MHCFIFSPFFRKYCTNAEYMVSSLPVVSKFKRMIPVISSAYGVNLDITVLDNIMYAVDKSDISL